MSEIIDYQAQIKIIESTMKVAIGIDLFAIGISLAANVAEAPKTPTGILIASVAPAFLALCVVAWHKGHTVLTGWLNVAFTVVLGGIASACGAVSFDHITKVAEAQGQSPEAAVAIAVIIDATAVLMALLVVACKNRRSELVAASQSQNERLEREAEDAAADEARKAKAAATREAKKAVREKAKAGKPKLTDAAFLAAVAANPEATNADLANRFGSTSRTIQRRRKKLNGAVAV